MRFFTELTNYKLDFQNIAIRISDHRVTGGYFLSQYTWKELLDRAFILTTTFACGYGGYYFETSVQNILLLASVGFVVSHGIAVIPVYQRRREIEDNMEDVITDIYAQLTDTSPDVIPLIQPMQSFIEYAKSISVPSDKRGHATMTLMARLLLVEKLKVSLTQFLWHLSVNSEDRENLMNQALTFWKQDFQTIEEHLNLNTDLSYIVCVRKEY